MCVIVSVWPGLSPCEVPRLPLSEVKDIPWLAGYHHMRTKNTQEVPGKVDRQDYGQRQQANDCHEQDDVALEGQVCDGVNAAFATDLLIPAEKRRRGKLSESLNTNR